MFTAARLKLTAYYLLILTVITVLFSLVVYRYSITEINQNLSPQAIRLFAESPWLEDAIMDEVRKNIVFKLEIVNLIILIASGVAAFFLAGETLRPIEETVEAQKRFVADASHELKTPLTTVKTEIEVALRDKNMTIADARELLKSNLEEVDKIKRFTDNLLSLSRYEAVGRRLAKNKLDLATVVSFAGERYKKIAGEKSVEIIFFLKSVKIVANEQAVTELASLLIDNAIKYSPKGSRINVETKKSGLRAILSVTDNGKGISPIDMPHIFERFYRSNTTRFNKEVEGYGLGLSIAKSIAEAHGGDIKAVNKQKGGVSFVVTLPV